MTVDHQRLHQLREDAKWGSSVEDQIKAVKELGSLGEAARESLEEILQVTVREEIKQCCIQAIKGLAKEGKQETARNEKNRLKVKRRRKTRTSSR